MRLLTTLLILFCTFNIQAQDYIAAIETYRDEKRAGLRKDAHGPLRPDQVDLVRYYPVNPDFKVTATVEVLYGQQKFRMPTYDGSSTEYIRFAKLTFLIDGVEHELKAYKNVALSKNPAYRNYLFVPFMDMTNEDATYEGGRYLELDAGEIQQGNIVLDFNKAYNPYCAYSDGYRCPVPPFENHLKTAIFAGELRYEGPKNERPVNKTATEKFNDTEQTIILSGDTTVTMHVYLTTDERELSVLQTPSKDIDPSDPLLPHLAQRMLATVNDPAHQGVGIAAPQVGINKNIIWVQRHDKADTPFELYLNPKIIWRSKLLRNGTEGCLSIPDQRADVERSYAIRLQYWTLDGTVKEENIEGFTAVIFQHEVDHLYGILFPNRVEEQEQKDLLPLSITPKFSIEKGSFRP